MTERNIQPQELSTGRDNHLVVMLDLRTGHSRVLLDPAAMRPATEAVRRAHEQAGVRVLMGPAA